MRLVRIKTYNTKNIKYFIILIFFRETLDLSIDSGLEIQFSDLSSQLFLNKKTIYEKP